MVVVDELLPEDRNSEWLAQTLHVNISLMTIASELNSWKCGVFSDEPETIVFIRNCLENYDRALISNIADDKAYKKLKTDVSVFVN